MAFALAAQACSALAQNAPEYEQPPILYSATPASNAVSRLQARLDQGQARLKSGAARECLAEVLAALGISPDSQVLAFSKTSLQRNLIEPQRPRAVYFSEDAYVGWVPGGLMEVAVTDPQLGVAFYRFDPRDAAAPAKFMRDAECLSCHGGSLTRNWPGLMVRSVFTDERGEPITAAGTFLTGQESPLSERWGGWYVTGSHGLARHMGNSVAQAQGGEAKLDRESGANVRNLARYCSTAPYLRPDSDIVALMVLEHQAGMHNRLIEGALRVRKWLDYQQNLQRELKQPVTAEPEGTAKRVVEAETARIVEHLLFCDEASLPEGGVRGAGAFESAFRKNRQVDGAGRSLKDFDLRTRLFQWPCSYLIYSEAFAALPPALKASVLRRLDEILAAPEPPKRFAHLTGEQRAVIRGILRATLPGFAGLARG